VRELIRSGASEAKLAVTLWNTGDDRFRPAAPYPKELGDWVTIERVIKATEGGGGGGGAGAGVNTTWRVTGERCGRVAGASRKALVDLLLDHLNVAAENPLCVMTQVRPLFEV
jgi:hypothetical protein